MMNDSALTTPFKLLLLFFVLSSNSVVFSQKGLVNKDTTYISSIATVGFHPIGNPLGYPLIKLNEGRLVLFFDDHRGGFTDLKYRVVHCDSNWKPSEITIAEYVSGFEEERMRNYEYSRNTYEDYTHYWIQFPNEDMDVLISGNYLFHVYQDDGFDTPLLTKRFMVAESMLNVFPRLKTPADASKYRTHQEFDVSVSFKDVRIVNPLREVRLSILQNGRWDNAILNLSPQSVRGEELVYDYFDKIVFPAGKEFRFFDTRSLRFRTERVQEITELKEGIDVHLTPEKSRELMNFINYVDANGRWVIENRDRGNSQFESEYALVYFYLDHPEMPGQEVYVCGGMTDWKLNRRFQMEYDKNNQRYSAQIMLKQGYYDYYFVVSEDGYHFSHHPLEGNWSETENEYLFLVYYFPFGERYERLVATSGIKTSRG